MVTGYRLDDVFNLSWNLFRRPDSIHVQILKRKCVFSFIHFPFSVTINP